MSGGGMFCPKDRGGCGKRLEWDDGAFCKECMTKALYERLKAMGVKEENDLPQAFSRKDRL
jgi:hypothetical protein